jgi:hypothetical protein
MSDQAPEKPHRIQLPRALREKDKDEKPPAPLSPVARGRRARRRAFAWVVVLVIAAAAGGALFLLEKMADDTKLQDCVMSGRKNCAPLDPKLGR